MPRKEFTKEQEAEIVSLYEKDKVSIDKIRKKFNCAKRYIKEYK